MQCPICKTKSKFYRKVVGNINFPDDKTIYELHRCPDCEHIFRTNFLDKHIYTPDYYAYQASDGLISKLAKKVFVKANGFPYNWLWNFFQNFTRYQNCPYVENSLVLDVGGGDGFALDLYKLTNNNTFNIEIDDQVVKASAEKGHKSYKSFSKLNNMKFDFIRVNQVIEHVNDPVFLVNQVYNHLNPEGKVIFGIPNIRAWSSHIYKDKFDQLSLPDHIHFFSEPSIKLTLDKFPKVKISYPWHKYGLLTNGYTLLIHRFPFLQNPVLLSLVTITTIPLNILSSLFKGTHLIDIECEI